MNFDGKLAVVVGGGAGWGRAASTRLAADGARVLVIDELEEDVTQTCAAISAAGGHAEGRVAAVGDLTELERIAADWNKPVPINALVTHYMAMDWHSIEHCEIADFERVVIHDLVGPVRAVKAFLPRLKAAAGHAAVVHIGSVDGLHGSPRVPSYSAAKGGLVPLTHVMAYEFSKFDIRVNAIATCQTVQISASELLDNSALAFPGFPGSDYMKQLNDATPLKRHGPYTDWAGAISFLASDDAAYVTGSVLVVDCGRVSITPGTQ
jgi:NAD(P)-dependent dehydrogenase (short-subunit alcohol dehydrogenase family)